jgi:hypothetical protein
VFLETQGDGRGEDRVLLRPKNARWKVSLEKNRRVWVGFCVSGLKIDQKANPNRPYIGQRNGAKKIASEGEKNCARKKMVPQCKRESATRKNAATVQKKGATKKIAPTCPAVRCDPRM